MLNFAELLCLVLAVNQTVEVWRHGRIAAHRRDLVDQGVAPYRLPSPIRDRLHRSRRLKALSTSLNDFVVDVLSCPWCTSIWVGGAVWCLYTLAGSPGRLCVMALAISRGANLLNDLTYRFGKTPKAQ